MVKIAYTRGAAKALAGLERKHHDRILAKIEQMSVDPDALAANVKGLKARPGRRLRVGDFRVIFEWRGDLLVILEVGHRRNIY